MSKWISAVSCLSKSSNFCGFILNPLSVSPDINGDTESTSRFREHMIFYRNQFCSFGHLPSAQSAYGSSSFGPASGPQFNLVPKSHDGSIQVT